MKGAHLTRDELLRLRDRDASPSEVLAAAEHLEECAACRALSSELDSDDAARRLLSSFGKPRDGVADHPDPETRLFPYVDGTLDPALAAEVERHLAECELCAEDVADLRATSVQRRRGRFWIAAVAAAAAAVFVIVLLTTVLRQRTAPPAPPAAHETALVQIAPDPWHQLVRSAVAAGRLEQPAVLARLRPRGEGLRGGDEHRATLRAPVGTVVESVRPRFSWEPVRGARYRLSILDGDRLVAQSPFIDAAAWECDRDLARGGVYSWQVEARRHGMRTVMPDPAEGDALFQVLDENDVRDIDAARRRFPDDHLLAGVLYARDGVTDRAAEELHLAAANPAQAADARRLLESMQQWQVWQ